MSESIIRGLIDCGTFILLMHGCELDVGGVKYQTCKEKKRTKEGKVEKQQEKGRDRQREKLGDVCDTAH